MKPWVHPDSPFATRPESTYKSGIVVQTTGATSARRGYTAGQAYGRSNPGKRKEVMEGFGYVAMTATGNWTVGFENSNFHPDEHPEPMWWLSIFEDTKSDLPNTGRPGGDFESSEPVHIRITGFLSVPGQYGHLSIYQREFYATTISVVKEKSP